ncbi:hypothetical protein EVAR_79113_1 [Eumeta japonica]|uniref:Uncharacterized protein n=1 Tax=Eumeta variegata TaxID=151549 RepID=A0A4C1X3V2_EUMVA|nr:hypothetical protein EVAR_79113_1 [Eumeta japonica]
MQGRAPPRRSRSTLTSARPRVNRDEQAAKLRSSLQSSEEVADGDRSTSRGMRVRLDLSQYVTDVTGRVSAQAPRLPKLES